MDPLIPRKNAALAAYLAAILNLVAAIGMWLWLKPGLPLPHTIMADRMSYVVSHPAWWIIGWGLCHLAALSMLGMYVGLAGQWLKLAPIPCVLALLMSAAGLCADLGAEMLYMGLAADLGAHDFGLLERVVGLLTGYLGNGMYSVAGVLLTVAGWKMMPIALRTLALAVWGAGLVLSGATLLEAPQVQFWSIAILMPSVVLWSAGIGRWLERSSV